MANYTSAHTGAEIDAAVGAALPDAIYYLGKHQVAYGVADSVGALTATLYDGTVVDYGATVTEDDTGEYYAGYEQITLGVIADDGSIFSAQLLGGLTLDLWMANADPMGNATAIVCVGDSLTQSAYPTELATATGRTVINTGRGSQGIRHIAARMGAVPVTMRVSGAEIVSGANSVTHINGVAISGGLGAGGAAGNQFLSRADSNTTDSVTGRLGSVRGTLTRTASGGPPSTTETYTFTPDVGEYLPAGCPDDTLFIADYEYRHLAHVFWVGSNDIGFAEVAERFEPYVAPMAESLGHRRFLALSPITKTNSDSTWQEGGTWWLEVQSASKILLEATRENYVPLRRMLIDQGLARASITATSQDNTDIAADMIPTSLKSDYIHHNSDGNAVIAEIVAEELNARSF